jgi:LysM repeat protein
MPPLAVEEQLAQSLHEPWAAKDWEKVIAVIEQILDINPDYDDMTEKLYAAHVNYGRQLAAEGRLEEAKEKLTRALEINPDGGEAMAELQALAAGETPVPSATSTPQAQYIIHVVQRGENLYRISLRYGVTVQAIMVANGLTNNIIYVGQQLRIPIY